MEGGDFAAAEPLFQRAIHLDPNFAMAYASLGQSYANLSQTNLAAEDTKRAYELREGGAGGRSQFIRKRSARTMPGQVLKVQGCTESRSGRCRSRGDRGRSCSHMSAMASPAVGPH